MTAERELSDWPWLTCHARKTRPTVASKAKRRPGRKHAGWMLELAFMLALALLLPRPKKRK
jgi:hypothetical protein